MRIPPKRSRRTPPAGFIHPSRPTIVATPRSGPEWVHEVKHDGYRMLARKAADRVTLWSRYGTDFTDKLQRIAEAVRALPVDDALLDGEAVVFKPGGHSDFAALRTRRGAEQAAFVAFDLLRMEGDDWRKYALEVRRAQLESLVAGIDALIFSEAIDDEGALVAAWRAPAPRRRGNTPVGFLCPCELTLVDRPPVGQGWLHEIKQDGFRILALKQGGRVRVWS